MPPDTPGRPASPPARAQGTRTPARGPGTPEREPPSRRARTRAATGRLGEELAAAHLRRRGFRILDRNVRGPGGEIDLIAGDGHVLAFVEVKTTRARPGARATPHPPLERVGHAQRRRLRRLALRWLLKRRDGRPRPALLRFDAIGVVVDAGGRLLALEHVEGAW